MRPTENRVLDTQPASALPRARLNSSRRLVTAVLTAGVLAGGASSAPSAQPRGNPPVYDYQVVNVYPHDPDAFCQGLAYADGFLYEGTGRYGQSALRKIDLETGRVVQYVSLGPEVFGEGITVWGDVIIQLTWKKQYGLVYDRTSFRRLSYFRYRGEGWGIADDGRRLVMSNGSATLQFLDPKTYRIVDRVVVHSGRRRIDNLNELENVEGEIFANVWGSDHIARISPETGEVFGWIDLTGILKPYRASGPDTVLNGIAYDRQNKRLFVTGKNWPKLFEIRLVPRGVRED